MGHFHSLKFNIGGQQERINAQQRTTSLNATRMPKMLKYKYMNYIG
jgi:hypothetical protein